MLWLDIDRSKNTPLIRQIYEELRTKILNKELIAGEKLPSTRRFSQELKVSRNILLEVYEQLISEGYLDSIEGSGTYVAKGTSLEKYTDYYAYDGGYINTDENKKNKSPDKINFISGTPDLKLFPRISWAKCLKEACLDVPMDYLNYSSSKGIYDLRISLSKLLLRTKGIKCNPDQVIVLSGSIEGFLIISKLLGDKYKQVIIEDPSYNGIKKVLETMNLNIYPVSSDEKGINTELIPMDKKAGFIIVTPSHHFPLGGVLPIQRRIKLIEYSRRMGVYIVENDYDSEFRYSGQPVSSLHLLDPNRVIHIGTFSESMYPGIRVGYMIVPEEIAGECKKIKGSLGLVKSSIKQLALSYFIKRGYFERHLNKMKKTYQKKREVLIMELKNAFNERVRITGDSTGLYVIADYNSINFTDKLLKKIENNGVSIYTVEEHSINKGNHLNKLIMGYGNLSINEIKTGVGRLKDAIGIKNNIMIKRRSI